MEVTGTVTDVRKEQRRSGEGFNYLLFIGETKYYLKEEEFNDTLGYKDVVATVGYTETKRGDKTYRNVLFIEPASESAIATALAENGSINSSIESQVAAYIVKDLIIAGSIDTKDPLFLALRVWCLNRLGASVSVKEPVSTTGETAPSDGVTDKQLTLIRSLLKDYNLDETDERIVKRLNDNYNIGILEDLSKQAASSFIKELQKKIEEREELPY